MNDKRSMKKIFVVFILPLLLTACFIYFVSWLHFINSIPYLVMAIVALAAAAVQLWLIKSKKHQKFIIIPKYIGIFIVSGFYTYMYIIAGPAGSGGMLIGQIIFMIFTTLSTIPLILLELKIFTK